MAVPEHLRDPAAITRQSFAIVEAEAGLERLPEPMRAIATRLVHASGMVDIVDDLRFSDGAAEAGLKALAAGAAVFTDVEMVRAGIIANRLPAGCEVICALNDPSVGNLAKTIANTRSAAAIDLWGQRLEGAVAVFGNAPTALFRLLERIDNGGPRPSVILGFPVGFVGAAESKAELASHPRGCQFITLAGRRGGSAMAAAAVNALAEALAASAS